MYRLENAKTIQELMELWKKKPAVESEYLDEESGEPIKVTIDHSNVFISDGPVCEDVWNDKTQGKKIAFFLKEAYGEKDDWKLNNWLKECGPCTNMWYRVVEWVYGIINTSAASVARYSPSEISFERIDGQPNDWLKYIAVVNIKKSGGMSSSKNGEILAYALSDKEEIIRELEILDPDIIICGGTASILNEILDKKIKKVHCDNWYYYSDALGHRERLFIDYYHPSNRYPALLNYYGIVNIYQQALLEKERNSKA